MDERLQKIMDDMLETMYAAPGIGLAAIQIGIPKRVIVLDIDQKEGKKNPMFFVNPEIIDKSKIIQLMKKVVYLYQGNLLKLDRPDKCHIKYLDYYGKEKEIKAEGMLATCIQHEMDHLEGILIY